MLIVMYGLGLIIENICLQYNYVITENFTGDKSACILLFISLNQFLDIENGEWRVILISL